MEILVEEGLNPNLDPNLNPNLNETLTQDEVDARFADIVEELEKETDELTPEQQEDIYQSPQAKDDGYSDQGWKYN